MTCMIHTTWGPLVISWFLPSYNYSHNNQTINVLIVATIQLSYLGGPLCQAVPFSPWQLSWQLATRLACTFGCRRVFSCSSDPLGAWRFPKKAKELQMAVLTCNTQCDSMMRKHQFVGLQYPMLSIRSYSFPLLTVETFNGACILHWNATSQSTCSLQDSSHPIMIPINYDLQMWKALISLVSHHFCSPRSLNSISRVDSICQGELEGQRQAWVGMGVHQRQSPSGLLYKLFNASKSGWAKIHEASSPQLWANLENPNTSELFFPKKLQQMTTRHISSHLENWLFQEWHWMKLNWNLHFIHRHPYI